MFRTVPLSIIGIFRCTHSNGICHTSLLTFCEQDHLIFQWKRLKNERDILKNGVLKVGNWPGSKSELTNRNLKQLIRHIN